MRHRQRFVLPVILLCLVTGVLAAQAQPSDTRQVPNTARLDELQTAFAADGAALRTARYRSLITADTGVMGVLNRDPDVQLVGIDSRGRLIFVMVENANAAISVGADLVHPGGVSGLNLDGANSAGQLAVWDGGAVRASHQEFGGRAAAGDTATVTHYHATHVAGTMIAAGVDAAAKGMSPAALIDYYQWTDDAAEMAGAAGAGLRVSNHSYGWGCGWSYSSSGGYWIWYGEHTVSATEEAGFGFYYSTAQGYDQVAYNAPGYLIFKSAGNDRNDAGPAAGEFYWYWNPDLGDWEWIDTPRDPDGGATGFDTIGYRGNAKNIVTVGAVNDVPSYAVPGDVVMSSFSNWGPTDDGRIKPDIVANGVSLYSTNDTGDTDYLSISGTSMASPNASGAANLLFSQYFDGHGAEARSATVKGLILHSAKEAGPADGPDYMNGWGLFDVHAAAQVVGDDGVDRDRIVETSLLDGASEDFVFYSDGLEPIALTICWTDPAGTPPAWSLDPPDLMLVNDLDLRLERLSDSFVHTPWILDPANPADPATTGDNFRDNVERIDVVAPPAGWYRVSVSHKGALQSGAQDYSLIQSGLRQVFHVAVGGDDSAAGTATAPLATLAGAAASLLGAGEIVLEAGTHTAGVLSFDRTVDLHGATGDAADAVVGGGSVAFTGSGGRLAHLTLGGATGTAVSVGSGADVLLEGCVIHDAGAHGLEVAGGAVTVNDCTVVANAQNGVSVTGGGEAYLLRTIVSHNGNLAVAASAGETVSLSCCDLFGNLGGDWAGVIAPQVDLNGNFSADPCYCAMGAGDFHVAADSWVLAGSHPWGCDDAVGALGAGCPGVNCAGVVANFVPALDAAVSGRTVELTWTARGVTDPDRFRVVRTMDGDLVHIPVVLRGEVFAAVDDRLPAAGARTVHYALFHNDGEGWTEIHEKSLDMDLPALVTHLVGASPNPFNPMTKIEYVLADRQEMSLSIYDVAGRRIATLVDAVRPAGPGLVIWQGTDGSGRSVASGTYFARLSTREGVTSLKLLLVQ